MSNERSALSAGTGKRPSDVVTPSSLVEGYNPTAKFLHWLIVVLLLTQFVIAALMPGIGPHTVPGTLL